MLDLTRACEIRLNGNVADIHLFSMNTVSSPEVRVSTRDLLCVKCTYVSREVPLAIAPRIRRELSSRDPGAQDGIRDKLINDLPLWTVLWSR